MYLKEHNQFEPQARQTDSETKGNHENTARNPVAVIPNQLIIIRRLTVVQLTALDT